MRSRRAIYFNVSLLSNHDIDADVLKESDYIFLVLIGNVKWVLIFFFLQWRRELFSLLWRSSRTGFRDFHDVQS